MDTAGANREVDAGRGLEADGLTKYDSAIPAVRGVSFQLRPGGVLGLLGPNGSGKSTTVSILAGLLEPSGGTIRFNGADIRDDILAYKALDRLRPRRGRPLHLPDWAGVSVSHRRPARAPAANRAVTHRRLHVALWPERRSARADVGLLQGDAAEDPDLGRPPAQSGDCHSRRTELRPRCDDDVRSAEPDSNAGRAKAGW